MSCPTSGSGPSSGVARIAPHFAQNRAPSTFSCPQASHFIDVSTGLHGPRGGFNNRRLFFPAREPVLRGRDATEFQRAIAATASRSDGPTRGAGRARAGARGARRGAEAG